MTSSRAGALGGPYWTPQAAPDDQGEAREMAIASGDAAGSEHDISIGWTVQMSKSHPVGVASRH